MSDHTKEFILRQCYKFGLHTYNIKTRTTEAKMRIQKHWKGEIQNGVAGQGKMTLMGIDKGGWCVQFIIVFDYRKVLSPQL